MGTDAVLDLAGVLLVLMLLAEMLVGTVAGDHPIIQRIQAFACDDVIRRAHISKDREQHATALR